MQHDLTLLEQRWGLALQSAVFGVWDLHVPEQKVHYSPQWKAMLGYADADEADSTALWRSRVHPDDLRPMLEALTDHLDRRTEAYAMEFRLRAADGSYRWVLSRGRVVERDAQARPVRMVGTLTDITDRREAEALRVAKERAEAAHRAKSEFLSRMSHELRTPLNAVLGFAQLLAPRIGTGDIDEQRRYLGHIEQAGWHLLAMIDNVLELSRAENGQLQLRLAPLALAPLMQEACDAAQPAAGVRTVRLGLTAVPADALVMADAQRLKQVLASLLGNAIRYNRAGGSVRVDVSAEAEAWSLSVADTGVGISAEQQAHLFEPFNRLGRTAGSGTEGVGIGLVLARWLIEAMGGRITVHSVEGVGSRFVFTVPRAADIVDTAGGTPRIPTAAPAL